MSKYCSIIRLSWHNRFDREHFSSVNVTTISSSIFHLSFIHLFIFIFFFLYFASRSLDRYNKLFDFVYFYNNFTYVHGYSIENSIRCVVFDYARYIRYITLIRSIKMDDINSTSLRHYIITSINHRPFYLMLIISPSSPISFYFYIFFIYVNFFRFNPNESICRNLK